MQKHLLKTSIIIKPLTLCFLVAIAFLTGTHCSDNKRHVIIKDHELKGEQWKSMHEISENFRKNVFRKCLDQSRLSMNCSDCEYIYIDVIIVINKDGRLGGYTKTKEKVCRGNAPEKLERCFIDYLESITFPKNLRNMSIETRLGTGLKC